MSLSPQVNLAGLVPGLRVPAGYGADPTPDGRPPAARHDVPMAPLLLAAADRPGPALDALVAVVVDQLDALGVQRAVLLGEGFSATVALRLAASHPDRVEELLLCAPVGYTSPLTQGRRRPTGFGDAVRAVCSGDPARAHQAVEVLAGAALERPEELAKEYAAAAADPDVVAAGEVLAGWLDTGEFDLAGTGRPDRVREVPQQVSLVWGRDDLWAPLDAGFYLTRRLRHVRLRVFPQCGHLVSAEVPALLERHRQTVLAEPAPVGAPEAPLERTAR